MNKRVKIIIGLCMLLVVSGLMCGNLRKVSASSTDEVITYYIEEDVENSRIHSELGIIIDGKKFELYPTYSDSLKELNDIRIRCAGYLNEVANVYNLEPLTENNWREYQSYVSLYLDDSSKAVIELVEFFDIYENEIANSKILDKIDENNDKEYLVKDEEFVNTLPKNAAEYIINKYGKSRRVTRSSFNVSKAVSYARMYAINHNKKEYKSCKSDCTNFVSQIVVAGGKRMTEEWKAYNKSVFGGEFTKYTMPWCNADYFVKYFGANDVYNKFEEMTQDVNVGNVIAYDLTNDNDWDHVGYVADKRIFSEELGYCDIEVAQHSRDYCLWASDSQNGWDKVADSYENAVFTFISFN